MGLKQFAQAAWLRLALAWLLGWYLRFALRTTRWTLLGEPHVAPHFAGTPCIVTFWHETLPLMPELFTDARRRRAQARVHVLVSRHRDGRFIGAVVGRFQMRLVYGSSDRGGRARGGGAALRTMVALLAGGDHVAITPDGPRGPRRVAAPGVAHLAAVSGAAILPCAAQTTRRVVLKTWDRMVIPLPFGRGVLVCGAPIIVPNEDPAAALPEIAAALDAACAEADRRCGLVPLARE